VRRSAGCGSSAMRGGSAIWAIGRTPQQ
jgi:hypothetical protein